MADGKETTSIPEYLTTRQVHDGLRLPPGISRSDFDSAIRYKPRPDDLFVVSYPKSGTTWVQYIVCLILRDGEPLKGPIMFGATPFLEFVGEDGIREYEKSLAIKSHLPLGYLPFCPEVAKYIYVCRNPKDTLVSYYFHNKSEAGCPEYVAMTMDVFFRSFVDGTTDYGDYFEHVTGFWKHRNDPNVLFLTYEQMKHDLKSAILRIACFMSENHGKKLSENSTLLEKITDEASFEKMKVHLNSSVQSAMDGTTAIPPKMQALINALSQIETMQSFANFQFARKGIVGDHVNHLTVEQEEELSCVSRQKLAECQDLLQLWDQQLK